MTKDKQAQRQRRDDRARAAMTARPGRGGSSRSPMTMALVAVGLVVVVVIGFVAVRLITGGKSQNSKGGPVDTVPAAILADVTGIPASTFDQVGTGGKLQVNYPVKLKGRPVQLNGKPYVMYLGADYCPYCAAERWSLVVALSRFGTFHNLRTTFSGSQDVFPNTPTFSFHGSSYSSPYITFQGVETYTNTLVNGSYTPLDQPTPLQARLFQTYDLPPYFPKQGAIPFVDFGNVYGVSGAGYLPTMMQSQTMASIAAALKDPSTQTSQAVLGVSNSLSAAVCAIDGGRPASVCQSSGVRAAAAATKRANA
jgi:Domain of unknown function (DUF929)